MATVMEFTSPADEFPLGTVFENLPGVTIELERLVPQASLIVPYFWVRGARAEDIEAAFETHAGIVEIELIDSAGGEYLMRAEWESEYYGILSALAASNVSILGGVGTSERWDFEVRADDRESISQFRAACQSHDIQIEITAVHELLPVRSEAHDLTDAQREALVLAHERGYFDSPRSTSLEGVAADLDITQQSLSSRLRRGHRRLIASTLVHQ